MAAGLNEHVQRYYSHPGLVLLPIDDAPATEWALVRRSNDTSALVQAFTETATTVGARVLNREG